MARLSRGRGFRSAVALSLVVGALALAPAAPGAARKDPLTGVELAIDVPQTGTSSQRVRAMWKDTRALIVKDAAANLTDEQYHAKRDPVFLSWTQFQEQLYQLRDAGAQKAQDVVPAILGVIDDLYGFGGQPEPRIESRNTFKKAMNERLAKIDEAVKTLP